MRLETLYEDEDLIAINKPALMLTVPDRFDTAQKNLRGILRKKFGEIYVVHRLDKETSGVIVFAKNATSHKILNESFADRTVDKTYLALAQKPIEAIGIIQENIAESIKAPGRYHIKSKGKAAVSEYEVIETFRNYALIRVKILTGRTHQIRVHLRHIGAPLLVDSKYGLSDAFYLSSIKRLRKRPETERPLISRCSLHAHSIKFNHPINTKELYIESTLPKDMKAVINQMKKNLSSED